MKKHFLSIFLILTLAGAGSLFAVDFSLRLNPGVAIPLKEHYKPAFNMTAQADLQLFDWITLGGEGNVLLETPEGASSAATFLYGGAGLGLYHNIFSRLYFGLGGAAGVYNFSFQEGNEKTSASDLYWRGYGELGFRINPTVTLSLNGGYNSFLQSTGFSSILDGSAKTMMAGPVAGLSFKFTLSSKKSSKNACYATIRQDADVLPLYMQLYKNDPVATVILTNGENAEIKNVTVSFTAGKYTSSALKTEPIAVIKKMRSVSVDLPVDFSSDLLSFAENGMMSGNLVIEYELLGQKKTSVQGVSISVSNRNSYMWGDTQSLAAYISPDTPEVLEYAKYVAGIARNKLYSGMNRNIQFAGTMFEALRESGIVYSGDIISPYVHYHLDNLPDYIQYPLQTMDFSSGDLDELGILYASCLESVGIGTAFIPMEDDFLILVDTTLKPSSAASHFANPDTLVITDETVYFALSMASFDQGFTASRAKGAELIEKINNSEDVWYDFIETHDAWINYPPAIFTGYGDVLDRPNQSTVEALFNNVVNDYVKSDLSVVIKNARSTGDSNKLGLAYVRAGQYENAIKEFSKTAATGSVAAMNNLGNVYMLLKDYEAAKKQYKQVLSIEPQNKTALKGLENISSILDD
ncbi:MAG: tetratricopeptide repeat protein [Treponema sp.]|nr:tetratricopeptide repeat protein [Treponema sp.]